MYLATTGMFHARWTNEIHDEWIGNLLEHRSDLTLEKLTKVRTLMDNAVPDALVEGYEPVMEMLETPDKNDRHVLAAAIHCSANYIVTNNLRDFPSSVLSPYEIEAITPDTFVCNLLRTNSEQVITALQLQRQTLKNPSMSIDEYLETLKRQGLERTVQLLRAHENSL